MHDDDLAVDFDEAWAEEDAKAPKIRLMGKIYTLPTTMPARLVLFVHRARVGADDNNREMKVTEVKGLVGTLIGTDAVDEIIERGIGFDRLGDVLKRCMDIYRKRNNTNTEDEPGEATAPTGAAPATTGSTSSSATGDSSPPTGTASTDETSRPISAVA